MTLDDLIEQNKDVWSRYIYHDFVKEVANSTLPKDKFLHYLKQDFLYLKHYLRAYLIAAYKSESLKDMEFFLSVQKSLFTELNHHQKYCEKFGISKQILENLDEGIGTISYTRYLLDVANTYGIYETLAAILPCAYGYYDFAQKIGKEIPFNKIDKDYEEWILMYKSKECIDATMQMKEFANEKLKDIDIKSKQGKNLSRIFKIASECEVSFWEQSYKIS